MSADNSELQLLEDDVQRLHNDLESGSLGGLRDSESVLNELNNLMEDESEVLKNRIKDETEVIEEAREDLKSDIETERKELELANSVQDEWKQLMEWKESQKEMVSDKGYVKVGRDYDNPVPPIKEIKNRLEQILELEQEELEDITGGSESEGLKGFIEEDLNQVVETHQRIALFREALVQISKETYAVDQGEYGITYELASELGMSDLQDLQQVWVHNEKHVEKIENEKLPAVLKREKDLIEEVENVFEELERLVELDKELLNQITDQSSDGSFFGIGSGDLYDVLNEAEVRPDGGVPSENDDLDPILPEAKQQLSQLSDVVDELKRESIGEGKQLDELMSETKEFIEEEKGKIESELNRLEEVDTGDAVPGDVPVGDYEAPIRQKAKNLKEIIADLRAANEGNHAQIGNIEEEFKDLRERAGRIHSMEEAEVEDIRDFDERTRKIKLMLEGDRDSGDDIEGVITAFRKYARRNEDISKVFDLPTDKQIEDGFPDTPLEDLPSHIQNQIRSNPNKSKEDLNPYSFMTVDDLLMAPDTSSIDFGLKQIYENSVQSLEKDIKRIYSEQSEVEDTFESLEEELNDLRQKFEMIEEKYGKYEKMKDKLSNTTIQTQNGVRNDITAQTEEAAALMAYDEQSPKQARKKLQGDFGKDGEISNWIERQIPRMIEDIEDIIYDSEGSIVNEEHIEEEEMEDAIKNITKSIELLKSEFDDDSVVTGVPDDIQTVVGNILESLASIAEKCTDFEEEEDRVIEEFREWAASYEDLRERSEEYSDSLGRGDRPSTKDLSDDIDHEVE
jgi:DNA repair exonuclease SbcCD ATPase subunit